MYEIPVGTLLRQITLLCIVNFIIEQARNCDQVHSLDRSIDIEIQNCVRDGLLITCSCFLRKLSLGNAFSQKGQA